MTACQMFANSVFFFSLYFSRLQLGIDLKLEWHCDLFKVDYLQNIYYVN